jgi:hypothetical protein
MMEGWVSACKFGCQVDARSLPFDAGPMGDCEGVRPALSAATLVGRSQQVDSLCRKRPQSSFRSY